LLVLLWVAPAAAQRSEVQRGVALCAEADFEQAIAVLERAVSNETLSQTEVELALDRIAAAQLALGDRDLDRTLARLALVAPDHRFGADVPESLADRFLRVVPTVEPVTVALELQPMPSGAERVMARLGPDPLGVVRAVELRCGSTVEVGVTPSIDRAAGTACEALVRGPGGIPITRARAEGAVLTDDAPRDGDDALWIGLGIGAGVLVLGAIFTAVAATSSSGPSNVTVVGPTIRF
jgi:hypothetical protein